MVRRTSYSDRLTGSAKGLQFAWWPETREAPGSCWGSLLVLLAGKPVWFVNEGNKLPGGVRWDWADLLEHLAGMWPWLCYEETYPLDSSPRHPGQLWERAQGCQGGLDALPDLEYDALVRFEHRHDLGGGLDGIALPSVLVLREGLFGWLACPEFQIAVKRPWRETLEVLQALGNTLADSIAESDGPAGHLVERWRQRECAAERLLLDLRSGFSASDRRCIRDDAEGEEFWEITGKKEMQDSELLAAARMTARSVDRDVVGGLIEAVRSLPMAETPELDALSDRVRSCLDSGDDDRQPFEEGHAAAACLRDALGLDGEKPFPDIEGYFRRWHVPIESWKIDREGRIDAVACWGPRHGPAVILNEIEDGRLSLSGARRATLAHELCHLLLDRDGSLPMAEVLGGNAPVVPEQRANAFAAELLLPREKALATVAGASSLEDALHALMRDYDVSGQLAANQARNAVGFEDVVTDPEEQARVRRWARLGLGHILPDRGR